MPGASRFGLCPFLQPHGSADPHLPAHALAKLVYLHHPSFSLKFGLLYMLFIPFGWNLLLPHPIHLGTSPFPCQCGCHSHPTQPQAGVPSPVLLRDLAFLSWHSPPSMVIASQVFCFPHQAVNSIKSATMSAVPSLIFPPPDLSPGHSRCLMGNISNEGMNE